MNRKRWIYFPLILLVAMAISFWNSEWKINPFDVGAHLVIGALACVVLHFKWKRSETPAAPRPKDLKDTFS
ncbi:MAG: hypothetical protein H6918_12845 [Sphingomonadaceae bacterium]|nr:hypothetical protein [Sphingomonadaceae bacterium]